MPNSIQILDSDVQDLIIGTEEIDSMIASIKSKISSGNATNEHGKIAIAQVTEEMNVLIKDLEEFKAIVVVEVEKLGDKEKNLNDLRELKKEIKDLHILFKGFLKQINDVQLEIKKEKQIQNELKAEAAELEAKIVAKTEEFKRQEREYQEKENEYEAQIKAIDAELARKKQLLEAELSNLETNYHYEGGDHSRSLL